MSKQMSKRGSDTEKWGRGMFALRGPQMDFQSKWGKLQVEEYRGVAMGIQ